MTPGRISDNTLDSLHSTASARLDELDQHRLRAAHIQAGRDMLDCDRLTSRQFGIMRDFRGRLR